ncbi:unnamed protein product, partial [Ectocarpus sp. 12 AP-2014]
MVRLRPRQEGGPRGHGSPVADPDFDPWVSVHPLGNATLVVRKRTASYAYDGAKRRTSVQQIHGCGGGCVSTKRGLVTALVAGCACACLCCIPERLVFAYNLSGARGEMGNCLRCRCHCTMVDVFFRLFGGVWC